METKYFLKPSKALSHPDWKKTKADPDHPGRAVETEELVEVTYDAYANLILSDAWWMGADNENECVARAESNARIQKALKDAGPSSEGGIVALQAGDLKWFCERARAFKPPPGAPVSLIAPQITTDFYLPMLRASTTDPREVKTETNGSPTAGVAPS